MLLLVLMTLLLGFAFPPLWMVTGGCAILLFAAWPALGVAKVERRLAAMVANRKEWETFDELHFQRARVYAASKGVRISPVYRDETSAKIVVGGRIYLATFLRARTGGTTVMLEMADIVADAVADSADFRLRTRGHGRRKVQANVATAGHGLYAAAYSA